MFSREQVGKKVKNTMQRIIQISKPFLGVLALSFWLLHPVIAANKPPVKGGTLPQIRLAIPKDTGEKSYLGISGEGYFKIPQIKTTIVIIEIFSLYCPVCQTSAPEVNALCQMIEQIPDLKDRIKMIGIGAGNSALEVNTFKEKYKVLFPLFPDQDFKIHKDLGEVRTPYFIVIKIKKDRTLEVVYSEEGAFGEAEMFLQKILKDSALKQ
jgi:peroxiredoxin